MNRLKDLRCDRDMTISETAELFKMHPTQYRRYESEESDIPLKWAIAFAKHYNVSLDYLAGLTNEPRQKTLSDYINFAEEIKKTVSRFYQQ